MYSKSAFSFKSITSQRPSIAPSCLLLLLLLLLHQSKWKRFRKNFRWTEFGAFDACRFVQKCWTNRRRSSSSHIFSSDGDSTTKFDFNLSAQWKFGLVSVYLKFKDNFAIHNLMSNAQKFTINVEITLGIPYAMTDDVNCILTLQSFWIFRALDWNHRVRCTLSFSLSKRLSRPNWAEPSRSNVWFFCCCY